MGIVVQKVEDLPDEGVIILAGIPGSGKSRLVEMIRNHRRSKFGELPYLSVHSVDNFFVGSNGEYQFDPTKLGKYHSRCFNGFREACKNIALRRGVKPHENCGLVIVDNTNTTPWEIAPYIREARSAELDLPTLTLFVSRSFEWCVRDQTHGVSIETMQRMAQNITHTIKDFPRYWDRKIWSWS